MLWYTQKMVKPEVRPAVKEDWPSIASQQILHTEGMDFDAVFPEEARWMVADFGKGAVASLGYIDRPGECQIMLLWNRGRYETLGAKALMNKIIEDTKGKTVWFATHNKTSQGARKAFEKWGFDCRAQNDLMSVYVKEN